MANSDVAVARGRRRLAVADPRPIRFDDEAVFNSIDLFDDARTDAAQKDRTHRVLAFQRTIETAVNRDPGPYMIRIDVAREANTRRDARACWSQGRVDETAVSQP